MTASVALPALRTPRLVLEPFRPEDVDTLHALWSDADVRRYLWDDEVIPRGRAVEAVEGAISSAVATGIGMWTVRELDSPGVVIGFCGLREVPCAGGVELLYGLLPARWGLGFATEASGAVLRYAFAGLRLPRVLAMADPPNVRSFGVMRRLGLTPLAETVADVPDGTYFAIDADTYFARTGG